MKKIIFTLVLNMLAIAMVTYLIPGLNYRGGIKTLVIISVVLAIANIFVRPIIRLLTLPIELITLGIFGVLINAGMLYLTAYLVPQFAIKGFLFEGVETTWFSINPLQIPAWGTAVIASTLMGLVTSTISWLTDR